MCGQTGEGPRNVHIEDSRMKKN